MIEAALVVMVGGVLLSTAAGALAAHLRQAKIAQTHEYMEAIQAALEQYLAANKKLPCPAVFDKPASAPEFGREILRDCMKEDKAGTIRASGAEGRKVRIGSVPVRSLNLSDKYAYDGWGARFIYAVTESLAAPDQYDKNLGAVFVVDSAGNSLVTPEGSAHYILLSHGADSLGARSSEGVLMSACPDKSEALDAENCNDDATFRNTTLYSTASGPEHYDDYVVYTNSKVGLLAVSCPEGEAMTGIKADGSATCIPFKMDCGPGYTMTSIDATGTPGCVLSAVSCPAGQVMMSITVDGKPNCAKISCPSGQTIGGIKADGSPVCVMAPKKPGAGHQEQPPSGETGGGQKPDYPAKPADPERPVGSPTDLCTGACSVTLTSGKDIINGATVFGRPPVCHDTVDADSAVCPQPAGGTDTYICMTTGWKLSRSRCR